MYRSFEEIEQKLETNLKQYTKATQASRRSIYKSFFNTVGRKNVYTDEDIINYIEAIKDKVKPSTLANAQRYILRMYDILGFKHDNVKKMKFSPYTDVTKRIFSKQEVDQMILKHTNLGHPYTVGVLFLSTIYAMRRVEIVNLKAEHIDIDEKVIYISTAKGGNKRYSLIPDVGIDIMRNMKNNMMNINKTDMNTLFKVIMFKTLGYNRDGFGFHAIRRRVIVELSKPEIGLDQLTIVRFIRWSSGIHSTLSKYLSAEPLKEEANTIDKEVLKVHPFLKTWEKALCSHT